MTIKHDQSKGRIILLPYLLSCKVKMFGARWIRNCLWAGTFLLHLKITSPTGVIECKLVFLLQITNWSLGAQMHLSNEHPFLSKPLPSCTVHYQSKINFQKWKLNFPLTFSFLAEDWCDCCVSLCFQKSTFWNQRVTSISLLLTISPLNHTLRSWEWRKWSPTKEALDCETNSPCQNLRKCIKDSVENMHTDVRL